MSSCARLPTALFCASGHLRSKVYSNRPGDSRYDPRMANVAQIAGQILRARRSEHQARLRSKLAQARRILPSLQPLDTLEQEKLEVLKGAVECLESPVKERAQAAMYILEQLAKVDNPAVQPPVSSSINARCAPVLTICPVKPVVPFRVPTALRSTG
jgi:hypothetical protein